MNRLYFNKNIKIHVFNWLCGCKYGANNQARFKPPLLPFFYIKCGKKKGHTRQLWEPWKLMLYIYIVKITFSDTVIGNFDYT